MEKHNEVIFLGGSKTIGQIPDRITQFLELFMSENAHFLIGDCHGADLAIQTYLHSKGYRNVTVYCSGDKCRLNVGDWDIKHIPVVEEYNGYSFYQAKDIAMINECSAALMLWDGKTRGTANNIDALKQRGVPIFTYCIDNKAKEKKT